MTHLPSCNKTAATDILFVLLRYKTCLHLCIIVSYSDQSFPCLPVVYVTWTPNKSINVHVCNSPTPHYNNFNERKTFRPYIYTRFNVAQLYESVLDKSITNEISKEICRMCFEIKLTVLGTKTNLFMEYQRINYCCSLSQAIYASSYWIHFQMS